MHKNTEQDGETARILSRQSEASSSNQELGELQDVWFFSGLTAEKTLDAKTALEKVHRRMSSKRRTFNYLTIAASVLLIMGVSYFTFHYPGDSPAVPSAPLQYTSGSDPVNRSLPDGSDVTLNKFSTLNYRKDLTERREATLSGEAFFEIAHDPEHPFIVTTRDLQIEVVGTRFNVRAYPDQPTVVTVQEGIVKTTRLNSNETVTLRAEDQIISEPEQIHDTPQKIENDNYLAWKTGLLEFKDSDLTEITARLEELYDISIIYDKNITTCKLTARFDNRDLDFILKVLEATLKIEVTHEGKDYRLSGPGC